MRLCGTPFASSPPNHRPYRRGYGTNAPELSVATLVLHGGADTCNHPDSSKGREAFFLRRYERKVLDGVGHFPQREAPQDVADAILQFCR